MSAGGSPTAMGVGEADVNLFKMEQHPGCPGALLVSQTNDAGLSPV